jgi:hypothetical protein
MAIVNVDIKQKPPNMSPSEFLFLVILVSSRKPDGEIRLTNPQIASASEMSERCVAMTKKSCKEKGFIDFTVKGKEVSKYKILCEAFTAYHGKADEAGPMTVEEIVSALSASKIQVENPPKNYDGSKLDEYIRVWAEWFMTKGVNATLPQLQKRFLTCLNWVVEKHKSLGKKGGISPAISKPKYTPESYGDEEPW